MKKIMLTRENALALAKLRAKHKVFRLAREREAEKAALELEEERAEASKEPCVDCSHWERRHFFRPDRSCFVPGCDCKGFRREIDVYPYGRPPSRREIRKDDDRTRRQQAQEERVRRDKEASSQRRVSDAEKKLITVGRRRIQQ